MTSPLHTISTSSDYFDNDPEFLRALQDIDLPEDISFVQAHTPNIADTGPEEPHAGQPTLKRRRSVEDSREESYEVSHHRVISSVDQDLSKSKYLSPDIYGASHFGAWGEYMARKRAKLQIQNAEMDSVDDIDREFKGRIFEGLEIYINGWTEPSVQDLRKLIIQHGGIFHAYLDKKSLVTHIITCSLTPAKVREFKHMKVVRPEWLVQSVKAGVLLPWYDFIFKPDERPEDSQGRQIAQSSLLQFGTQRPRVTVETSVGGGARSSRIDTVGTSRPDTTKYAATPSTPPRTPEKIAPFTPLRPHYSTDPATPEEAKRMSGYAGAGPNKAAQRAMADPAWRAAHTSIAPDFIEGYYRNSRLHHLSTWKAELRQLVAEAQERAENGQDADEAIFVHSNNDDTVGKIVRENMRGKSWVADGEGQDVSMRGALLERKSKGKEKEKAVDEERVIMHCDFDSFFVSASLVDRPHLRGKPVVVCHSQGAQGGQTSTSEIASASYEARKYGIKSGMSLRQARELCPEIATVPYDFQKYKQFSLQFYTILMSHADDLQAVSVDEALIDVTSSVRRINAEVAASQDSSVIPFDPAKELAEAIRVQVKNATGCEVSIGISHNIMLARLATRKAKPAGSYHLYLRDLAEFIEPLEIDDLHGFGYSSREKAQEKLGTTSLGRLAKMSKGVLCEALGKGTGETLYNALRGIDNRTLESDKPRKSVSCDINYGIRFENNEQAKTFVYQLAEEVVRRLKSIEMRGRSLTLKVMKRDPTAPVEAPKFMGHGICDTFNKQVQLVGSGKPATDDPKIIGEHAWRLLKAMNFDPKELRGIGIQLQKLEKVSDIPNVEPGQVVLPFKPVVTSKEPREEKQAQTEDSTSPDIRVQPPSQPIPNADPPTANQAIDLPSFSQVDMSVFEALPDDVRQELEQEYKRRSVTPTAPSHSRSRSPIIQPPPKPKVTFAGSKSPNLKRITRQLAPRSRSSIPMAKTKLFTMPTSSPAVQVSVEELRRLDIDPVVFYMLPVDVQSEQLALMRQKRAPGGSGLAFGSQRKAIKAKKIQGKPIPKRPPPKAVYTQPPALKQRGPTKGEKLYFTEKDDIQQVIEAWVNGFLEHPPNQKDVDFFAKFLVQCVNDVSDTGVERAVAVTKWWLILLRRHFGAWEDVSHDTPFTSKAPHTSEMVGRTWWRAFREVKQRLDAAARKKFGGSLSLR